MKLSRLLVFPNGVIRIFYFSVRDKFSEIPENLYVVIWIRFWKWKKKSLFSLKRDFRMRNLVTDTNVRLSVVTLPAQYEPIVHLAAILSDFYPINLSYSC